MSVNFQKSLICKLAGHIGSNPEILISYPPFEGENIDKQEIITLCLPFGCKAGDLIEQKYQKHDLLSFVFSIEKTEERDDLLSFSILLNRDQNLELYKSVIERFIAELRQNNLLTEEFFTSHQKVIYESLNQEKDIKIDNILIPLSQFFKEKRKELKSQFDPRGRFF